VQLTPCGRRLYEYAREVLALHDRAREEITGQAAPVRGELAAGGTRQRRSQTARVAFARLRV